MFLKFNATGIAKSDDAILNRVARVNPGDQQETVLHSYIANSF